MERGCGLLNLGQVTRINCNCSGRPSVSNIYCQANVTGASKRVDLGLVGAGGFISAQRQAWALGARHGGEKQGKLSQSASTGDLPSEGEEASG